MKKYWIRTPSGHEISLDAGSLEAARKEAVQFLRLTDGTIIERWYKLTQQSEHKLCSK